MKHYFTYILIFVSACILYPSCRGVNGIALTKRHYRPGFYVDRSSKETNSEIEVADRGTSGPANEIQASPKEENHSDPAKNGETSRKAATTSEGKTHPIKVVEQASLENNRKSHRGGTNSVKKTTAVPELIDKYMNRTPFNIVKLSKKTLPAHEPGEGHSLFWILIVLLLALWAIGYLTGGWGLGAAIHVILIIALVLLILWLLRIV